MEAMEIAGGCHYGAVRRLIVSAQLQHNTLHAAFLRTISMPMAAVSLGRQIGLEDIL